MDNIASMTRFLHLKWLIAEESPRILEIVVDVINTLVDFILRLYYRLAHF